TLGAANWQMIEPAKVEDGRTYDRAVFQAAVQGVLITKTYTLNKDDYHVGLEVRLEREQGTKDSGPFRYQLSGLHGLRMEGDWYTTTHRNALMCRRDSKGNPWREFQDLRYISLRGGGNDVRSDEEKILSYGGTAVQYFASITVVDDQQSNRAFLKSARPTLETATFKGKFKKRTADQFLVVSEKETHTFEGASDSPVKAKLDAIPLGAEIGVLYRTDAYDQEVAFDVLPGEKTNPLFLDDITVRLNTQPIEIKANAPVVHKYLLYNGPVKVRLLATLTGDKKVPDELVDRYLNN